MPCLRKLVFVTCALPDPVIAKGRAICRNVASPSLSSVRSPPVRFCWSPAPPPRRPRRRPATVSRPSRAAAAGRPRCEARGPMKPAASPAAKVMAVVGTTEVTVEYSSPGVKKRKIWGELVAYGKPWRTGANSSHQGDVQPGSRGRRQVGPGGHLQPADHPDAKSWTIILNKNTGIGGNIEEKYKQEEDVARFTVTPTRIPARERLTFIISDASRRGRDDRPRVGEGAGLDPDQDQEGRQLMRHAGQLGRGRVRLSGLAGLSSPHRRPPSSWNCRGPAPRPG